MKKFRLLSAVAVIVVSTVAVSLNACSNPRETRAPKEMYAQTSPAIPASQTLSGNYLAGRFAQRQQDWQSAQGYMNHVMWFDRDNPQLQQRTFLLSLGSGKYTSARKLAKNILAADDNTELALIYLICDAMAAENYAEAAALLEQLPDDGFGQYTKPLLAAWSEVGLGNTDVALDILLRHADTDDPTYNIHAALIAEMSKDTSKAEAHYRAAMEGGLTLHGAIIAANFFERTGGGALARSIYQGLGAVYPIDPFVRGVSTKQTPVLPNITRAADGAGIALLDLATLLYERRAYDSAQIYSNLVLLLTPGSAYATLMLGDIASMYERHDEGIAAYNAVEKGSIYYWLSRLRVAEVMEASDRMDEATVLLNGLSEAKETRVHALIALGDLYRRHERFAEALTSYDHALEAIGDIREEHWPIVYARGMSLERLNDWKRAEKDLLLALEFQPDNPMILNYIGYSWAEKGVNLNKALEYIRRAVAQRPDDGYILDSYGWVLYRTGNYAEAVKWMERAVAVIPDDSTLLDHLGDAYWQNGRYNEARFKWERAHDVSQDQNFKTSVRRKIRFGVEPEPPQVVQSQAAKL